MAGWNFRLALAVLLAVLSYCSRAQDDVPTLCYTFSVSASGPPWCEFLGMINGTQYFKYPCKNKMAKPVGQLEMMLNATEVWNQHSEHCENFVEDFQKALLNNKENISKAFHSPSLQVHMMCRQESNGCHSPFCLLDINEQMCLRFDLNNGHWTERHPGCRSLKETLESEKAGTSLRVLFSDVEQIVKLLNQSRVQDPEAAPAMAATSASPPTVSATSNATATSKGEIRSISIVSVIVICFILFCIIYMCRTRCCSKAPERV